MSSIFAYVDLTLFGYLAIFIATLVFSQKIKDFFAGIPADMRTGMKAAEAKLLADVATYRGSLIAKLAPPATPVAPAAPEPPKAA